MIELDQTTAGPILLESARRFTGIPYLYGVHDCSWTSEQGALGADIVLPRTSEEQAFLYRLSPTVHTQEGDLLFIPGDPIDANPGHVMIYVEPGQVFEAEETGTLIGQKPYDTSVFEYRTRPALAHPLPTTVARFAVVRADAAMVEEAQRNGWAKRYWDGKTFPAEAPVPLRTTCFYVSKNYKVPHGPVRPA